MRNRERRLSTYVPPQPIPEQTEEKQQQQPNQKRVPESAPEPDEG